MDLPPQFRARDRVGALNCHRGKPDDAAFQFGRAALGGRGAHLVLYQDYRKNRPAEAR